MYPACVTGQGGISRLSGGELAAPVEIEAATPPAATLPKPLKKGGGNRTQTGTAGNCASWRGGQKLHWEYNENGQPVVRDSTDLSGERRRRSAWKHRSL